MVKKLAKVNEFFAWWTDWLIKNQDSTAVSLNIKKFEQRTYKSDMKLHQLEASLLDVNLVLCSWTTTLIFSLSHFWKKITKNRYFETNYLNNC